MSKSVLRPLLFQIQSGVLRRLCHEPSKLSNTERPPKDPPDEGYEPTSVDHDGIDVPDFVSPAAFRQFSDPDEQLGPGAGKAAEYKNGHYFAYHRFSFHELQILANDLRDDGGLQASIQADEEPEDQEKELETMKKLEAECDEILASYAKENNGAAIREEEIPEEEIKGKDKQKAQKIGKEKQKAQMIGKVKPKEGAEAEKGIQDMSEKELEERSPKKEAAIKEKEKSKAEIIEKKTLKEVKEKEKPKGEIKEKEKVKEAKAEESLQYMSEKELEEWCLKKEAAIKEEEKSKAEIKEKETPKEVKEKSKPKEGIKGKEKVKEAKTGKSLQDMSEKELEEWCLKKEAGIKEKEKSKAEIKEKEAPKEVKEKEKPKGEIKGKKKVKEAKASKSLQDMSEKELEEWCLKKEAAIKEKEKSKAEIKEKETPKEVKGKEKPKEEIKEKEKVKEAKAGKSLQDMSEKELNEWCLKKEADIKEIVKKKEEQAKECDEEEK